MEKVVDRVKDATGAGNRKWVLVYRRAGFHTKVTEHEKKVSNGCFEIGDARAI